MLKFDKVSKKYNDFFALKDFTYTFPGKGLVSIVGKSGSGKTTIANLISLIDKPSEGKIFFNNIDINTFNKKRVQAYRNKDISFIFQHYNLLLDSNVIDNIILPRLLFQESELEAKHDACLLLDKIGLDSNSYKNKLVKDLSGGEAQRVAILRALINSPSILIADEPTGALDEKNSISIMEIFKSISKKRLIILISHNIELVDKYSDQIIILKDGRIVDIKIKTKLETKNNKEFQVNHKIGKNQNWIIKKSLKKIKTNIIKDSLCISSMIVGISFVFLNIGFNNGIKNIIDDKCIQRLDYGTNKIYKVDKIDIPNSSLKINKMTRLDESEIYEISEYNKDLNFELNFDALYKNIKVTHKDVSLTQTTVSPIYKFNEEYLDAELILKGTIPANDGILVNKSFENYLKKTIDIDSVIGIDINLSSNYIYYHNQIDENQIQIKDEFIINKTFKVYGVVDEFSFMSIPKIYFDYSNLTNTLKESVMINLSKFLGEEYTWYDLISDVSNTSELSSFSHYAFFKAKDFKKINVNNLDVGSIKNIEMEGEGLILKQSFISLTDAISKGLLIFCLLTCFGTCLIIGISSFSSFMLDKKHNAILYAFGANKEQIFSIYLFENLIITFFAFFFSLFFSWACQSLINSFIYNRYYLDKIIDIPFLYFNGKFLYLILIVFIFVLGASILSSYFPLQFSKSISIKKELSDE